MEKSEFVLEVGALCRDTLESFFEAKQKRTKKIYPLIILTKEEQNMLGDGNNGNKEH